MTSETRLNILPQGRQGLPWRRINPPMLGEIQGIPTMRGYATATNGILVIIEPTGIGPSRIGHIAFFVVDKEEHQERIDEMKREKRSEKKTRVFEEFVV